MKVSLSWRERVHLLGVMSRWQGWSAMEVRHVWALMERLELNADEKAAVGYEEKVVNGAIVEVISSEIATPPADKEFTINDRDVVRIKNALKGFPFTASRADRVWLEPLLSKFLPEISEEEG